MKEALQQYQNRLHISHSQIFCYLACSLKYQFQYVLQLPKERISLALPFGKAIHTSIERYYRSLMDDGAIVSLELLETIFEESLTLELDSAQEPIIFKAEAPDTDSAIDMGKGLLKTFYENIDLAGMEIVAVELPLSATLYSPSGERTDINLVGVIDLLLRDADGNLLVVDNMRKSLGNGANCPKLCVTPCPSHSSVSCSPLFESNATRRVSGELVPSVVAMTAISPA